MIVAPSTQNADAKMGDPNEIPATARSVHSRLVVALTRISRIGVGASGDDSHNLLRYASASTSTLLL